MFKIPKQEYTPEFKELAVKRVTSGQGIAAVAKDLGLVEQTVAQLGEGSQEGQAQSTRDEGGDARADGALTATGGKCAATPGV